MELRFQIRAELWFFPGGAGWYFITLPLDCSEEIREHGAGRGKAFGSVKVTATLGGQQWSTSLFPESKSKCYVMPVKKDIRQGAGITTGDFVDLTLVVNV